MNNALCVRLPGDLESVHKSMYYIFTDVSKVYAVWWHVYIVQLQTWLHLKAATQPYGRRAVVSWCLYNKSLLSYVVFVIRSFVSFEKKTSYVLCESDPRSGRCWTLKRFVEHVCLFSRELIVCSGCFFFHKRFIFKKWRNKVVVVFTFIIITIIYLWKHTHEFYQMNALFFQWLWP